MSQWVDVRVFLIPNSKLKALKILRSKDFYGDGVDIPGVRQCGISEYPWHPAFVEIDEYCRNNDTWIRATKVPLFCRLAKFQMMRKLYHCQHQLCIRDGVSLANPYQLRG
jgi:hypothetical protein